MKKISFLIQIIILSQTLYFIGFCPDEDEMCISCSGKRCNICIGSFANSEGKCEVPEKKIWRCLRYNQKGQCLDCKYGYYLNEDGSCTQISQSNCLQYDYDMNCVMCNEGIMVKDGSCNSGNACQEENCQYCALVDQQEKCLSCKAGYNVIIIEDEYKCVKEKESTQNCWILMNGNAEQCSICKYDYFYQAGNCTRSDEYIVFMNLFRTQVQHLAWFALIFIQF